MVKWRVAARIPVSNEEDRPALPRTKLLFFNPDNLYRFIHAHGVPRAGERSLILMEGQPANPAFGLRRCFMLCLPALLIGALLRIWFLAAIPEAYYGSDSPSYFEATAKLWSRNHGRTLFTEKRRWLYPMLLMPLPLLPVSPARTIPIFQALLGLGTVFGVGWITGNVTRLRAVWVPVVTTLCAISPKILWYEHEVVAESVFLALFVLTVALAMPPGSLLDRKRLFWFFVSAAGVAALKPHGRGIWLGCILYALLITGNPLRWGGRCWGALAAALVIMLTSGEKQQANWLLLDSTLPLVNLDAPKWKEYRDAIRPLVLQARQELDQYAWAQQKYKKQLGDGNPATIDPVWANLTRREKEFSEVCGGLGKEAVRAHPFTFARLAFTKIGISFASPGHYIEKMNPAEFWRSQTEQNADHWSDVRRQLHWFYGMEKPGYDQKATERASYHNATLPFLAAVSNAMVWMRDNSDAAGKHWLTPCWPIVLAAFGFLACLTPARLAPLSLLWLPTSLCLVSVHAIGDYNSQYVQPVEWVLLVFIAIGLDAFIEALRSLATPSMAKATPATALQQAES